MKIPKHIDELIIKRRKLAEQLSQVSTDLDDWLEKNEFNTLTDYTGTGCLIYLDPYSAEQDVRNDILNDLNKIKSQKDIVNTEIYKLI